MAKAGVMDLESKVSSTLERARRISGGAAS